MIVDTGCFIALGVESDPHHQRAVDALSKLREPLITTWPVITETCHLLLARQSVTAQLAFLAALRNGAYEIFPLARSHVATMEDLMARYVDLPMDLADASLVVLAEELGSGRILSTDERDFKTYRWKSTKPFKNLLL